MTTPLIDHSLSLDSLYDQLLRRKRVIDLKGQSGKMVCQHCRHSQDEHCHDMRCSISTSNTFLSTDHDERIKIDKAIVLVEQLTSL